MEEEDYESYDILSLFSGLYWSGAFDFFSEFEKIANDKEENEEKMFWVKWGYFNQL